MGKRVLVIVLLAALALFAYVGYSSYDARRAGVTGQVFLSDSSRSKSTSETRGPASSGSSAADPTTADKAAASQETETIVYPPAAATQGMQAPAGSGGATQVTQAQQAAPATAPGSDTISPNPANGMVFSGSGRYQLYRQGNITWRMDSETGRSCIIFATDEEWRKPRVYKAGCGRT
jgi:hypothetical protein